MSGRATLAAVAAAALVFAVQSAVAAEPTFVDGEAQPVFASTSALWINEEAWVESEVDSDLDGKRDLVHVDISRVSETLTDGLKVPVVLEMSPYYAGNTTVTSNWPVDHEIGEPPESRNPSSPATFRNTSPQISTSHEANWVPRGFAVMHAESLGSGLSEGCPTSGGRNETLGAKAVIDWLRGRAKAFTSTDRSAEVAAFWTNGKVGMIGTSYNGTLPNAAATTGVEGLEAIVPISAISNWYDYYRANGAVRAPGGFQGEDLDVLVEYVYSRPDRLICRGVLADVASKQDRRTGDSSPFWEERNYMNDVDKVHAAVLVAHGNNDNNVMTKHAAQFYEALKERGVPHQLYWHQGGHGGSPPLSQLNKWFTRYLWNYPNDVESRPKAWVVREGQSSANPTPYAEWPDPDAADAVVSLRPGAPAIGALTFLTPEPALETLTDDASITAATLANAASSPNRLVFKTPVLSAPIRISGTPKVSLRVSFSKAKANLTAILVNYPGTTGTGTIVTRGWIDPENPTAPDVTEPVTPGAMYRLDFDLQARDSVIAAGRRLGLVILSSDRDHSIRPAAGTQLTVDLAESSFMLPVVGGGKALAEATGVTAPSIAYALDPATPSGDAGWYTGPVSLAWQVAENGAATTRTGCADASITSDGEFTRSCSASNVVGSAGPVAVTVKRDATAPAVSVGRVRDGAVYLTTTVPTPDCRTSDPTSGVASEAALSLAGGPRVGSFTATCAGARDVAGNTGLASATYRVLYAWKGFLGGIANPPTVNARKAGSTVQLKFRLGGDYGLGVLAGAPTFRPTSCATGDPTGPAADAPAAKPFAFSSGTYAYAWKTSKAMAGTCGRLDLRLDDETTHSALFRFTT